MGVETAITKVELKSGRRVVVPILSQCKTCSTKTVRHQVYQLQVIAVRITGKVVTLKLAGFTVENFV